SASTSSRRKPHLVIGSKFACAKHAPLHKGNSVMSDNDEGKVPVAPDGKNPFEDFADRADTTQMWLGSLFKFTKGDYLVGRDGEEFPEKEVVGLMPGLLVGLECWIDGYPVDRKMGLLMEGFVMPARSTLDYAEKSTWPLDINGQPRDPWQETNYLPVISVNAENVYTFVTSSDGGRRRAIVPLCREYGQRIRTHPDELPVFGLEQDSYIHPDRSIGRVKFPVFPVRRWVKAEPYLAAVMTLTGRSLKLLPAPPKAA